MDPSRFEFSDNFGRTGEINYVNTATDTSTDDFAYGYDRDGNVLYKNNLLNSADSELYHANSASAGDDNSAYDPLNRLVNFERGTLSVSGNNGSALDTVASSSTTQSWDLDAVGNQSSVTTDGATTSNATNSKNELTANGSNALSFDNDGNTLGDGSGQTYTYDAWNRLATAKDSVGAVIASYNYDAQSRRIADTMASQDRYYDSDGQEIEDRDSSGAVTIQNVWSADGYVQDLVLRDDTSSSGSLGASSSGLGQRLYVQQDANSNVTALTSNSGVVAERFITDPYGTQIILTGDWLPITDGYSWVYGFQGGRFEAGTDLYHFGARDYNASLERWTEQDPAGYVDSANSYDFEENTPLSSLDPAGLATASTQPSVDYDYKNTLKEFDSVDAINAEYRRLLHGAAIIKIRAITDFDLTDITYAKAAPCQIIVKSFSFQTTNYMLTPTAYVQSFGVADWKQYSDGRDKYLAITNSEWYHGGGFQAYQETLVHEQAHSQQWVQVVKEIVNKYAASVASVKYLSSDAADGALAAKNRGKASKLLTLRTDVQDQFLLDFKPPPDSGFRATEYGENEAVQAARDWLEANMAAQPPLQPTTKP